jgi:hypothetical protein
MHRSFAGGCHCGRIAVVFHSSKAPRDLNPRVDQCGFCVRHSAAVVSDPDGQVILEFPKDPPAPYRFGLAMTDFHICDRCGVYVAASWLDGDERFAVVNVNALDDRSAFCGDRVLTDFDREDVASRSARRRLAWTPATFCWRD